MSSKFLASTPVVLLLLLPALVFSQQRDPNWATSFDNGTLLGQTINFNNFIYIRVLAVTGGFAVVRQNCTQDGTCQQTKMIVIRMNSLVETGANGQEVGLRSATPHSFSNFAQQRFTVFTRSGVYVPFSNVTADSIQLTTTLYGLSATTGLSINIYTVRDYGVINITNEIQYLVPGMVKFTFNVTRWDFCGCPLYPFINSVPSQSPLTNVELGTYLDLYFEIQSPITPQQKFNNPNMPRLFGLDSSTGSIALSSRVVLDDVTYTMDPLYPLYKNLGNKQVFVVRFARFNRSAYYDPTLTVSGDIDSGTHLVTSLIVTITGLLTALICVHLT